MKARNLLSEAISRVTHAAGTATAVVAVAALIAAWSAVGAVRGFSEHWLAVMHAVAAGTTLLMVFVLRHAEGRESRATLLKLDELLTAVEGAREHVVGIEHDDLHVQERAEQERKPS